MAQFPAMPLWTDAYLADTTHLSTLEHGAYLLLLIAMWRNKASLPNDDRRLARFAGLTNAQWRRIKPIIMAFFTVEGDQIYQGRLTDEYSARQNFSQSQRKRANARWLKNKNTTDADASAGHEPGNAETDASPKPIPKPNQPVKKETETDVGAHHTLSDTEIAEFGLTCLKIFGWEDDPTVQWGIVHQWLADGLDRDRIIVALKEIEANGKRPGTPTLKYYDRSVREAADPKLATSGGRSGGGQNGEYKFVSETERIKHRVDYVVNHGRDWIPEWGDPPPEVVEVMRLRAVQGEPKSTTANDNGG